MKRTLHARSFDSSQYTTINNHKHITLKNKNKDFKKEVCVLFGYFFLLIKFQINCSPSFASMTLLLHVSQFSLSQFTLEEQWGQIALWKH